MERSERARKDQGRNADLEIHQARLIRESRKAATEVEQKPVEVIQADLDEAHAFWLQHMAAGSSYNLAEAFARYRISHAAPVPREPTAEMLRVGEQASRLFDLTMIWRAMYDAAPATPRMSGDLVARLRAKASACLTIAADMRRRLANAGCGKRLDVEQDKGTIADIGALYAEAADRIESDAALIRRLAEALEPFAIAADYYDTSLDADDLPVGPYADNCVAGPGGVHVVHFRRARQALAATKQGEGRS